MAQNTFPAFTNMLPTVEDIQLIVDSLRQEDRFRVTKDGIFTPGIVNEQDTYLQAGTDENSLKIKPFTAYTANGNRINVEYIYDNLYAQGNVITVTDKNKVSEYLNVPEWRPWNLNYENLDSAGSIQHLPVIELGRGSVLHGIKLRINSLFNIPSSQTQPNVYVSVGTESDPEKFLPQTLVSETSSSTSLSVMNLMYSFDDANTTQIYATFTSDSVNLNTLTSGALTLHFCVADLAGFDNEDLSQTNGGFELSKTQTQWQASTTYYIVARYTETALSDSIRGLNYATKDGTVITTVPEPTRYRTGYKFYALRKTGSTIDSSTLDDIKLGEVVTDENRNIVSININGKNASGNNYTDYLTLPGYRFVDGINADQIGNGDVTNEQFSYLNTLTGNVQNQLSSKASLNSDNTFEGVNTFTKQIVGSIDKVNGFSAYATPVANSLLVLDSNGKIPSGAISESSLSTLGNSYIVSSGITKNGRASFLVPSNDNTSIVIKASSENPLVLTYPNGSTETFIEDQNITDITTDGNYYIIKEQNGNFVTLPTAGGTKATIPAPSSGNYFDYEGTAGGQVVSYFEPSTAYLAFDGTIITGTKMGQVYQRIPSLFSGSVNDWVISYSPSEIPTYLIVHFPTAITPTSFSACFRRNQYDVTPKEWTFEATNDDYDSASANWIPLISSSNSGWNINEIKSISIPQVEDSDKPVAYKNFRFKFYVNQNTVNNYMYGEITPNEGVTMPINCYYFQIYSTIDSSYKGNVIEGYIRPTDLNVGSYFLDISKKPYRGYKCVGNNEFVDCNFVKLGLVNVVGLNDGIESNTEITCNSFSYNNFTISDEYIPNTVEEGLTYSIWTTGSNPKVYTNKISINVPLTFGHNLGVIPNTIKMKFKCLIANNGYSVGDYVTDLYSADPITYPQTQTVIGYNFTSIASAYNVTSTRLRILPGVTSTYLYVKNKTTGVFGTVSSGQWAVIIYCSRGW